MDKYTTLRIHASTRRRLIQTRGKLEHQNGKRRSLEDVVNELINHYNKKEES